MSVIACRLTKDKIHISSDSQLTHGANLDPKEMLHYDKLLQIKKKNQTLTLGLTGSVADADLLIYYLRNVIEDEALDEIKTKDDMTDFLYTYRTWYAEYTGGAVDKEMSCLFIVNKKVFYMEFDIRFVGEVNEYISVGAGEEIANTVLDMGYMPEEAVEKACKFSLYCALPIVSFIIDR